MNLPVNLGDFVCRATAPDHPLFIGLDDDGNASVVTRAAFDALADAIARGLLERGLRRGDRIAILASNRPDYVAVVMGAMRAGIVPVPVNYKFPPERIAEVIRDCDARLVIHDAERAGAVNRASFNDVRFIAFDGAGPDNLSGWLSPGEFQPVAPDADEPALSLYTSGSTGRPKGVLLGHAAHIWVAAVRLRDSDLAAGRMLIAAPLYHMNALALALFACASGTTAVIMPQFRTVPYIEAISQHGCTFLTAVPPMIAMMLREKEALAKADLSGVRAVRMGSAPVTDALSEQISKLLPGARIINAYGTTEGGPIVFAGHPDGLPAPVGSVGYPHPEVQCRLVGPDAPHAGALEMKSPAIMLGYHNRPDVARPITDDGYYRTGDVFRRDANGFHYFLGRTDDMFVCGGENIFPGEVEAVLDRHPAVLQSCVVPVADEIKGAKPVAYVVRRAGVDIGEEALKQYMLANAPVYQHPRRIWFLDQMPLATTNKTDRAALMLQAEAAVNGVQAQSGT